MSISLPQMVDPNPDFRFENAGDESAGTPVAKFKRNGKNWQYYSRPGKHRETSPRIVRRAIPPGWVLPKHTNHVLHAFDSHPSLGALRSDTRNVLRRCLVAMLRTVDYATMTSRVTKMQLAQIVGVHERTISRYWRKLEALNVLSMVANGRSAKAVASKPNAPIQHDRSELAMGPANRVHAEAAVWVFCVPSKELLSAWCRHQEHDGLSSKDELATPSSEARFNLTKEELNPRTRAKNTNSRKHCQLLATFSTQQRLWNKFDAPQTKSEMLLAAEKLREISPYVFGAMTDHDVRSLCRDFFVAGWSPQDVKLALTWQKDGKLWPHATIPKYASLERIRPWVKYRLSFWREVDSSPMTSPGQKRKDELKQRESLRQQEVKRLAARQALIKDQAESGTKQRALSKIRAMISRTKQEQSVLSSRLPILT